MVRATSLFALFCLAGCSAGEDIAAVNSAAQRFHDLQAAGDDAAIYREASDALRANATVETMARLNTAVRNARCESEFPEQATSWNLNAHTSGYFVTLTYQRQCQQSPFVETFTYVKNGEDWLFYFYNADGLALFPTTASPPSTEPATAPATEPTPISQSPSDASSN
ncbi:MAG: hypothetical protein K2P58_07560 [Hyphomonadaceae bacterium]|nr:hypothetical protein [Hyphomonadaceae bacterium]